MSSRFTRTHVLFQMNGADLEDMSKKNYRNGEKWFVKDPCGIVCAVMTYCLMAYGTFAFLTILVPPFVSIWTLINTGIYLSLVTLAVISHYKSMCTEPVSIACIVIIIDRAISGRHFVSFFNLDVDQNVYPYFSHHLQGVVPREPISEEEVLIRHQNGEKLRYCKKCRSLKPDRAHHCSTCERCIQRMDHHCPWCVWVGVGVNYSTCMQSILTVPLSFYRRVNNCVGENNQKYFVLFTVS